MAEAPKISGHVKHVGATSSVSNAQKPDTSKKTLPMVKHKAPAAEPKPEVIEKLNNTGIAIAENNTLLLKESNPKKRAGIKSQNEKLEAKQNKQKEYAATSSTEDGKKIKFEVKKDVNVNDLKNAFNIKEGVLANNEELNLKPHWVDNDPNGVGEGNSSAHMDWTNVVVKKGATFTLDPSAIEQEKSQKKGFLGFFK